MKISSSKSEAMVLGLLEVLRRNIIVRAKSSSFYTVAAFYLYFWNSIDECVLQARDGVLSHNVLLSNAQLNRHDFITLYTFDTSNKGLLSSKRRFVPFKEDQK
ncbi:hypothetical protein XENOCAPTIV_013611 [Xenoophorus captivus]|uniref:Uncharacterized protein n=1 Tax=Xenoophorus captivus TaxID=1517983 RepID=A0ABV0Q5R9_9TELE